MKILDIVKIAFAGLLTTVRLCLLLALFISLFSVRGFCDVSIPAAASQAAGELWLYAQDMKETWKSKAKKLQEKATKDPSYQDEADAAKKLAGEWANQEAAAAKSQIDNEAIANLKAYGNYLNSGEVSAPLKDSSGNQIGNGTLNVPENQRVDYGTISADGKLTTPEEIAKMNQINPTYTASDNTSYNLKPVQAGDTSTTWTNGSQSVSYVGDGVGGQPDYFQQNAIPSNQLANLQTGGGSSPSGVTGGETAPTGNSVAHSGSFFSKIAPGRTFTIDGTQYTATDASTYISGNREPNGPFVYQVPTATGAITVQVSGGWGTPLINSIKRK
jgi:hypothetical protein